MYTNVHCSTVYNSKDLESTQMSISDRLSKENVAPITMEYYAAIKKDEFMFFESGNKIIHFLEKKQLFGD